MAASNDHIRKTVERYVELMNAGDAGGIAELGETDSIEIIDVMAFDDDGRIASMRAFWSAS